MIFKPENVQGVEIKEGQEYQGVRVTFQTFLETAQIKLQVDVGFGDVVTPEAEIAANRIPRKVANGSDRRVRRRQRKANPRESIPAKK